MISDLALRAEPCTFQVVGVPRAAMDAEVSGKSIEDRD